MSDTEHTFDWMTADRVTVAKIEAAVLDVAYSAYTDDGLQEGIPGDYLVREAGDEDSRNWRVIPAHIAAETVVPHLEPAAAATTEPPKPRRSRKKADA